MSTAIQRKLAKPGDHHMTTCLDQSRPFTMPKGAERLLCELPLGHDLREGHAATVDGSPIRWRGGPRA